MPPRTRDGEGPSKGKGHEKECTRQGDSSVTQPGAKSVRAKSHHQTTLDDQGDPLRNAVQARNRLIQEQRELIRMLRQQLRDERASSPPPAHSRASGPPPKHDQAPTHERDLKRVHQEEDSSGDHVPEGPEKQRQTPEDKEELKHWIDKLIRRAVRQNMETAGITSDQFGIFGAEDLGASPFSRKIRRLTLPEEFSVPKFTLYDGISDPAAHLRHFVQRMSVWGDNDFLNCRIFSSSLGDLPLRWFCTLPADSISCWQQLRRSFLVKFQANRNIPRTCADLMALRMREDESVTQFSRRFWTVYSQVESASDEVAVRSFQQALRPGTKLREHLVMFPVATLNELMTRASRFIEAEEDEARGRENLGDHYEGWTPGTDELIQEESTPSSSASMPEDSRVR